MNALPPLPPITIGAFCEQAETYHLLMQVAADPRLSRVQMQVESGGLLSACEILRDRATPDLLMIESHEGREILLEQLDALADVCDSDTRLIIIGAVNDIMLYRDLIERGVSEYIVHPFLPTDLVRLISGLYAEPSERLVGRVIAVTGAKGGVGSSTLSHNLAASMARVLDAHIVLVDMDIAFGTAGLNFNQDPPASLMDVIEGGERVDMNFVERLLINVDKNLSLIAAPALVEVAQDFSANVFDRFF